MPLLQKWESGLTDRRYFRPLFSYTSFSEAIIPFLEFSIFSLFERLELLNWILDESHVHGRHFNVCFFPAEMGFEFAPTLGNTVSVGDQLTANQSYKCGTDKNLS